MKHTRVFFKEKKILKIPFPADKNLKFYLNDETCQVFHLLHKKNKYISHKPPITQKDMSS